jgi:hypothetical protein
MKILTLGSGNAFSREYGNASILLHENGKNLVVDCGTQNAQSLWDAGLNPSDIEGWIITHAHADHAGGLEEMAFSRYDWFKRPQHYSEGSYAPKLYADANLVPELWENTLKGGLKSMEGFLATMETFFEVVPIKPNTSFFWQGWEIKFVQQLHVMTGSVAMWSFGLMISKPGHKTLYYTADSQHMSPSQMKVFYRQADVIIQDCELIGCDFEFQEGDKYYTDDTGKNHPWPTEDLESLSAGALYEMKYHKVCKFSSGVHANFGELSGYDSSNSAKLTGEIKGKMWLFHTQDFRKKNDNPFGLTDEEIQRIQDAGISNSQQYKMAGNSIVVDQMFFLKNLLHDYFY